jgi:hypothetical protein
MRSTVMITIVLMRSLLGLARETHSRDCETVWCAAGRDRVTGPPLLSEAERLLLTPQRALAGTAVEAGCYAS